MAVIEKMEQTIIGIFALLILVLILGALSTTLTPELTNAFKHPNGLLILGIIGLFGVAFAIKILMDMFKDRSEPSGGGF